jgi:hypothetical protein
MAASQSTRWFLLTVGIVILGMVALFLLWRKNPGSPVSFLDRLDSALISVEELATGERSEPTPKATPVLDADLRSAVQALLSTAVVNGLSPYQEFSKTDWPPDVQRLNPVAVAYFDSTNHPDGDGVIIVVERHRGWDAGVLFCRQRNSEWQGVHLNGQVMRAGPDFGFSRLQKDGIFWHWYRTNWASSQPSAPSNRRSAPDATVAPVAGGR